MIILFLIIICILLVIYMWEQNDILFILINLSFIPAVVGLVLTIMNGDFNLFTITIHSCFLIELYLHLLYYKTGLRVFDVLGDYAIGGLYTTFILYLIT